MAARPGALQTWLLRLFVVSAVALGIYLLGTGTLSMAAERALSWFDLVAFIALASLAVVVFAVRRPPR